MPTSPARIVCATSHSSRSSSAPAKQQRIDLALRREAARQRFQQALASDDDRQILQFADLEVEPALNAADRQRLALARVRQAALQRFEHALYAGDAHKIIAAYDSVLNGYAEVSSEHRKRYAETRRSIEMPQKVRAGIAADDDTLIVRAYDPALVRPFTAFTPAEQRRIERALQRMRGQVEPQEDAAAVTPVEIRRYHLELSHSAEFGVSVGDTITLILRLAAVEAGAVTPRRSGVRLEFQAGPGNLSLFIRADGFALQEGESTIELPLPASQDESVEARIELEARKRGQQAILVEPFYAGQRIAAIELPLSVRFAPLAAPEKTPALADPHGPRPVPHPDVYLWVTAQPLEDIERVRLSYYLYSPQPQLRLPGVPTGSQVVSHRRLHHLRARLEWLLRRSPAHASAERAAGLEALGRELYNLLFPKILKTYYEELTDRDQVKSLLILCDAEPWIPWELVRPYGETWEHDALAGRYQIGRWIEGWGIPRAAELPLGPVCLATDAALAGRHSAAE
jgi:hypothetical protein